MLLGKNIIILNIKLTMKIVIREIAYSTSFLLSLMKLITVKYVSISTKPHFRSAFCPILNCVCFDSLICTVKVITSENVVFDKLYASLEKYLKVF